MSHEPPPSRPKLKKLILDDRYEEALALLEKDPSSDAQLSSSDAWLLDLAKARHAEALSIKKEMSKAGSAEGGWQIHYDKPECKVMYRPNDGTGSPFHSFRVSGPVSGGR